MLLRLSPLRGKVWHPASVARAVHTERALAAVDARLANLKAYELKDVAVQCGVSTSGRKSELCERIRGRFSSAIASATPPHHVDFEPAHLIPASVVSLDLGYRNLAHVHLTRDNTILAWDRTDLDIPDGSTFHPFVSTPYVRGYVQTRLEPLLLLSDGAGAVLVEQQRYREGGAAAVLETTIRVNSIEAMLWYALYDMVDRHSALATLLLAPIQRQAVDRVWAPEWERFTAAAGKSTSRKARNYHKKQASARLVEHWLQENQVVRCHSPSIRDGFLQQTKKDDMGDCLLQAMTWYQWRRFMVDYIHDALLHCPA